MLQWEWSQDGWLPGKSDKTLYRCRAVAKWGQYRLERDQGSPVEGVRPCPVGDVTLWLSQPITPAVFTLSHVTYKISSFHFGQHSLLSPLSLCFFYPPSLYLLTTFPIRLLVYNFAYQHLWKNPKGLSSLSPQKIRFWQDLAFKFSSCPLSKKKHQETHGFLGAFLLKTKCFLFFSRGKGFFYYF